MMPQRLLAGTVSLPEDRTVLGLNIGLINSSHTMSLQNSFESLSQVGCVSCVAPSFAVNHPFGVTIQQESPFHILQFTVQGLGCGGKFLDRLKRVLITDCLCCTGCFDLKLRYLSE